MQTLGNLAGMGADRSPAPLAHAVAALLLLLVATTLSVYKPRGVTPYGWRKQQEQRKALQVAPQDPVRVESA